MMAAKLFLFSTISWIILWGCSGNHSHIHSDRFQETLGHIKPSTSPETQAKATGQLIARTIGKERANDFIIKIDPNLGPPGKDTFQIRTKGPRTVEIRATTGVTAAWGFHYFIKEYCNCHISWEGSQIRIPNTWPNVHLAIISNDRFRYYQNVCTAGYTSAWWNWEQWEKNIDWMALNGINLALAFHGQEAIWTKIYHELHLKKVEINRHFGGPAFLPWSRMGNIRAWGGPLTPSWHNHTIILQHKILDRMNELGIIPVLPAFAGHVPRALARVHPMVNMTKVDQWNKFEDKYCCPYLLSPQEPLFKEIGGKFLKAYIKEFGTSHVYNCDIFNENEPSSTDLKDLRDIGKAVYATMTDVDPQAIWMMQGWLFVHDEMYWTKPRVEALVTSVPIGKMIVLDLQSEQFPQYTRLHSYYGQPFIWCMLHNFGGTLGMFGSAKIINERVFDGRKMNGSTMIGTGLTPEGINQNYVIYELMNEMAYRHKSIPLDAWFHRYSLRRYGVDNEYTSEAWRILGNTVYDFNGNRKIRGHYVITRKPSLKIEPWTWYDKESVLTAWDIFLRARSGRANVTLYRHDLVDITRQALQLIADDLYVNIRNAFQTQNLTELRSQSALLLELFDDLEMILAASDNFLLGKWIRDARLLGITDTERNLYEKNARNQITLWGPNGEIRDYANKQWSGVVADYFKPRWSIFIQALDDSITSGKKFNGTQTDKKIFDQVEKLFTESRKEYPVAPQGDSISIAVRLNKKWRNRSINKSN